MFLDVFTAEVVDGATAGMIIVILLIVLPYSLSFWPFVEHTKLFTVNIWGQLYKNVKLKACKGIFDLDVMLIHKI